MGWGHVNVCIAFDAKVASGAASWRRSGMRLLLAAAVLFLATSSIARADDVGCVSTTFNLLSPNDKVCVSDFDDPKVPGGHLLHLPS